MPAIFNHLWIIAIIVTVLEGLIWKSKSKKYIAENPELKNGYDSLIKRWLIYGSIPWFIMGIGIITGLTKSIDEFFYPRLGNPIVIVFFLSIIVLWILVSYWIYFKEGAEKLVKHPGLFTHTEKGNEKFELMKIKLLWLISILCGIFGIYMIW